MEWILSSERLPDVKEDTLFLCAIWSTIYNQYFVDTRTFWHVSQMFSGAFQVHYWMPLPEVPEEIRL